MVAIENSSSDENACKEMSGDDKRYRKHTTDIDLVDLMFLKP
jgi:hypothetical protein